MYQPFQSSRVLFLNLQRMHILPLSQTGSFRSCNTLLFCMCLVLSFKSIAAQIQTKARRLQGSEEKDERRQRKEERRGWLLNQHSFCFPRDRWQCKAGPKRGLKSKAKAAALTAEGADRTGADGDGAWRRKQRPAAPEWPGPGDDATRRTSDLIVVPG